VSLEEKEGVSLESFGVSFFLHNTKSSSFEKLKKCIGRMFWEDLENLHEFFKFNISIYNILKIKNILTININLLEKNYSFTKCERFYPFPLYF